MTNATFSITVPHNFHFWHTVYSHGWCSLRPFKVDKEKGSLSRILVLEKNIPVLCQITSDRKKELSIQASSLQKLSIAQTKDIIRQVSSCLRLSEDLSSFYQEARRFPRFRWITQMKAGRLLRAPSVFEDIVKMICTTNCSWALTETMINNLVEEFGVPFDDSLKSFPTPEDLARTTEQYLRKNIKAGYRSPFLLEFATAIVEGKLNVESWRTTSLPTPLLYKELRSIKGVGEYAAGNILKLLGRYDYLGLDSWVRGQYYSLYHQGRKVSDRTIERKYQPYGTWRGLFFWMEMTKHWYDHEFPF